MKVLVAEKIAAAGIELMRDRGFEVDVRLDLTPETLVEAIPGYDALIVRSATRATREVIEAGVDLKVIGRAGVGIDNVDVDAATSRGIIVCNAPTSNVVSAAEHTMALILAMARRIAPADASMKAGKWERAKFTGSELYEKTLAICGLGRIGGLVAERAKAFGMNLVGYDPFCSPERAAHLGVTLYPTVDELLPLADFITVHLPKTKETIGMFGPKQFSEMRDGVYLVNTARGGIYDVQALADFVRAGKVGGAAIDVFEQEPCTDSPLREFENVILTPHLGASTREAQDRAGVQIAEFVAMGLEGRMVPTAVNVAPIPADVMEAVGPYVNLAQDMGTILAQLAREGISSLEIEVYGALAAYDTRILGTALLKGVLAQSVSDPVNFVNAEYLAEQRGLTVAEKKDPECTDYLSMGRFVAHAGDQEIELAATLGGRSHKPRIVSIFGYDLDLVPATYIAVFKYADRPGMLGKIGTILGSADVNIATMEIGRDTEGGIAIVIMNLDQPVDDALLARLMSEVGMDDAWFVEL